MALWWCMPWIQACCGKHALQMTSLLLLFVQLDTSQGASTWPCGGTRIRLWPAAAS
jgi:hypothetical protein